MGVPIPEISKRIGHSSPKTTMDKYSHIFDINQEKSAMLLIDKKLLLEHSAANSFTLPIGSITIFALHSNAIKDSDNKC